jgi:hypothetical protein
VRAFVPLAGLALAAAVLTAPAGAGLPQASDLPVPAARPTAVTLWIDGGYVPLTRWLEFKADGQAQVEGMFGVAEPSGRYRAAVDYAKVERVLTDAGVCTREAPPLTTPPGMDMFTYKVVVRCADRLRYFSTFAGNAAKPETVAVRDVVAGLQRIGAQLAWERSPETGAAPRSPYVYPERLKDVPAAKPSP